MPKFKVILCDYINPINDTSCQFVKNGCLVLRSQDNVKDKAYEIEYAGERQGLELPEGAEVIDKSGQLALPGFIDLHFHWVQDDVRLMPKASLLEWLSKYTWPYEKKFEDVDYSKERAKKFSKELLSIGTLGGACYGSIHPHTVDHALEHFVGHYILGNVLMTENSPDYLTQVESTCLQEVQELSEKYREKYALTPRFAPTVSAGLMRKGAKIANEYGTFIQSHLSETREECEFVLDLYKESFKDQKVDTYTGVYQACDILGPRTIMGHGIYLSDKELEMLGGAQTAIAHCPTSNAPVEELGLGSGLFDFKKTEDSAIPWALGSDIGGGPFLSMFDVMDSFVRQNERGGVEGATFVKGLYRATRAGAHILKLSDKIGRLEKGVEASFVFVENPNLESAEEALRKICSTDGEKASREQLEAKILETYFQGHSVFTRD